jgi:hypothetical protein
MFRLSYADDESHRPSPNVNRLLLECCLQYQTPTVKDDASAMFALQCAIEIVALHTDDADPYDDRLRGLLFGVVRGGWGRSERFNINILRLVSVVFQRNISDGAQLCEWGVLRVFSPIPPRYPGSPLWIHVFGLFLSLTPDCRATWDFICENFHVIALALVDSDVRDEDDLFRIQATITDVVVWIASATTFNQLRASNPSVFEGMMELIRKRCDGAKGWFERNRGDTGDVGGGKCDRCDWSKARSNLVVIRNTLALVGQIGGYGSDTETIKWINGIIDVIWPLFEVGASKEEDKDTEDSKGQDTMFKKGVDTVVDTILLATALYITYTEEVEVDAEQLKSIGEMLKKIRPRQGPESRVLSADDRDRFDIAQRCIKRLEFLEQEAAGRGNPHPPQALAPPPSPQAPPKLQRAPLRTIRK